MAIEDILDTMEEGMMNAEEAMYASILRSAIDITISSGELPLFVSSASGMNTSTCVPLFSRSARRLGEDDARRTDGKRLPNSSCSVSGSIILCTGLPPLLSSSILLPLLLWPRRAHPSSS